MISEDRHITVKVLLDHDRKRLQADSIEDAIEKVKDATGRAVCTKIILPNDDIVYSSRRHGDIEDWAAEYRREKKRLSASREARDCPFDNLGCYEDSLCLDCKLEKAQHG